MKYRTLICTVSLCILCMVLGKGTVYANDIQIPVQDEQTVVEDEQTAVEDEQTAVEDEQTAVEDEQTEQIESETDISDLPAEKTEVHRGWYYDNGWYYYNQDGTLAKGWRMVDGIWYYLDEENEEFPGIMISDQKKTINGVTYFFDGSGKMLTGWIKKPEGWYYTEKSGAQVFGWKQVEKYWYYLDRGNEENPGLMVSNTKKTVNNAIYFFDGSGKMLTGWIKKPEGWYYTEKSGAQIFGWKQVEKYWYYLDKGNEENPGLMVSNTKKTVNNAVYFFDGSGKMLTGWIKKPEGWYYTEKSGAQVFGWKQVGKYWYYLDKGNEENPGRMVSNCWKEINGKRYYFKSSGEMATRWLKLGTEWYYMSTDGAMRTDWVAIDGHWYYFYKENDSHGGNWGQMAKNVDIDGYRVGRNGIYAESYKYASAVLDRVGWDLWSAFQYSAGLSYRKMTANPSPGSDWFALQGFRNGSGNCYVMAATFYYMADLLGYDVHQVTGYVPLIGGGYNPHSWCEIVMNGTTYVFDPDFAHETGRNGYQISYGTSGTWRYSYYSRMN